MVLRASFIISKRMFSLTKLLPLKEKSRIITLLWFVALHISPRILDLSILLLPACNPLLLPHLTLGKILGILCLLNGIPEVQQPVIPFRLPLVGHTSRRFCEAFWLWM